jgi:hypothetical protein
MNIDLAPGEKPEDELRNEFPSRYRHNGYKTELSQSFHRDPDRQRKWEPTAFTLFQGPDGEISVPAARVRDTWTDKEPKRYPQCVRVCLHAYVISAAIPKARAPEKELYAAPPGMASTHP